MIYVNRTEGDDVCSRYKAALNLIYVHGSPDDFAWQTALEALRDVAPEPDMHTVCIIAAGEMMKAGITRHISYINKSDLTTLQYPEWSGGSGLMPKVTIEWVSAKETIDNGI